MNETPSSDVDKTKNINGSEARVSFPLIVIGTSMGGMTALKTLVAGLPSPLGAAVFIVWHIAPDVKGILPDILNKVTNLHAANAVEGEKITEDRIYVAPPDHHLLIEADTVRVTKGPKENRFRPAVDPLFRSAAYYYYNKVIGVILTGALNDGTAGLWAVKSYGGIAIVQDLADAEIASMPQSAMEHVDVDYSLPVAVMPRLLAGLVSELNIMPFNTNDMQKDKNMEIEIRIAADKTGLDAGVMNLGDLSPFTCPECHGVLTAIREGNLKRFRCHTGHAFSSDSLLSALTEHIEDSLWNAIRSIRESTMLLNHIGDHYAEANQLSLAAAYFRKAQEANVRAEKMRAIAVNHESLSEENVSAAVAELEQ